jgi:hypothetical protein
MEEKEYQRVVIQPVVRMYATPDRAVRMALLENLERYVEGVSAKDVSEKVWPHLVRRYSCYHSIFRRAGHWIRRRRSRYSGSDGQVDPHHRPQGTSRLFLATTDS